MQYRHQSTKSKADQRADNFSPEDRNGVKYYPVLKVWKPVTLRKKKKKKKFKKSGHLQVNRRSKNDHALTKTDEMQVYPV